MRCRPPNFQVEIYMSTWKVFKDLDQAEQQKALLWMFQPRIQWQLAASTCRSQLQVKAVDTGSVIDYRFLNNTPFGIRQWMMKADDMKQIETLALEALSESFLAPTVDRTPTKNRTKLFFGYRYTYGKGKSVLVDDVDPICRLP